MIRKALIAFAAAGGVLLAAVWAGLRIRPKPFPPHPEPSNLNESVDLPDDLPAPVERFYRTVSGARVPVINSAVVTGTASVRLGGLTFPARFRFAYLAGSAYRHNIEVTLFGVPVVKVNEIYRDGQARLELPFGVVENEPKTNEAANLGLWAEAVWLPSVLLTDSRVRWEAIGEHSARLLVPYGDQEQAFTVSFDPNSGLLRTLETLRYREPDDEARILWRNQALGWRVFNGMRVPSPAAVIWMDQDGPWAVFSVEDITYNVDVVGSYFASTAV